MNDPVTTCALCGHKYPPESHQECISCPVQSDCNIICCPECGYSDVDPSKSKVVNWISSNIFNSKDDNRTQIALDNPPNITVADLPPGTEAIVFSLGGIHETRREQLMAYGLAPGRCVQVLQHNPATILKVDQTELAIEDDVARRIIVTEPRRIGSNSPRDTRRRSPRLRRRLKFLRRRRRGGRD